MFQKSIYRLKQASQSWNIHFDEVVKGFGFIKNEEEACIYKKESGSSVAFLILYVDDILLIGNNIPMLEFVKTSLKNSFSMKDLGEAAYILGIKIYRDRSKSLIGLSQDAYIDKVLIWKRQRKGSCLCHMAYILARLSVPQRLMSESA